MPYNIINFEELEHAEIFFLERIFVLNRNYRKKLQKIMFMPGFYNEHIPYETYGFCQKFFISDSSDRNVVLIYKHKKVYS